MDTFPKILRHNAQNLSLRVAAREKDLGIWQSWTWAQVYDEVRLFALGLHALGLRRGDKLAIVGDNRPRLYWTFAAVQSLGAVPVPVYQDSVAQEMAFVIDHGDVVMAVVEDQEQVDKMMLITETVKGIKHIIYDDPRGLDKYDKSAIHSFESVQALGADRLRDDAAAGDWWQGEIDKSTGADHAVILYTSGTTGNPKGVVLSYDNLVLTARNAARFDGLTVDDEVLAYLPMAWVGDHVFSYAQSYAIGFCVSCPESPETMMQDLLEIGPSYFFAPPRIFENILTSVMVRMEDASKTKQKVFHYFLAHARRVGEAILNRQPVGVLDRLVYGLGELLVYGPLKNTLGLSRVRIGYTAGEAIGPEIFRFYRSLGINLKQLYGQTESSVFITAQPDGEIFADTVGVPAPDVEVQIADNGEVLYRSPGVFQEYYKNPQATKKTKTKDGWVHTGDAGYFDDAGHLKIIDRSSDVGKLNDGTLFAPKFIENKLKFFPNIKEAVAFGDGKDYCAVFINIDLVAMGSWAERNNVAYASYQELAAFPTVYDMIADHIDEVNADLAGDPHMAGSQITRFLILHKELDADDGELTRTRKVRRNVVADRYGDLIDGLFNGSQSVDIKSEVTFEDGRRGTISANLVIRDVKTRAPAKLSEAAE